ncbi:hypothetical protein [Microbacterium sp.]|uniref:hypothetical protein n=1 Tax=Microbacterium sp. TaxID=51671 RepID=UPI0028A9AB3C|nr:hypothetical protein [Microbacterium sp.]
MLMLSFSEQHEFIGVFVGSDRTKRRHLYEVPIGPVIDLFDHVAREDVVVSTWNQFEPATRLSQHDLVEIDAARYGDETHTWHIARKDFDPTHLSELDGLDESQRAAITRVWQMRRPAAISGSDQA